MKFVDQDAVVSHLAKQAASKMPERALKVFCPYKPIVVKLVLIMFLRMCVLSLPRRPLTSLRHTAKTSPAPIRQASLCCLKMRPATDAVGQRSWHFGQRMEEDSIGNEDDTECCKRYIGVCKQNPCRRHLERSAENVVSARWCLLLVRALVFVPYELKPRSGLPDSC